MRFYMATDGYADQMGGLKRRRFGSKRFKDLLLKNEDKSFDAQRRELIRTINEYRGDSERLDDITVVGFAL